MAHVAVTPQPGIVGLLQHYPQTGRPLSDLAEALLRGPSPLSPAERELIATYTSTLNRCAFCAGSHGAAARRMADAPETVDAVLADPATAPVGGRMRALLAIAARVQGGGRAVSDGDVAAARAEGASDREIHDTVLIAAAFCMYNRYVDGLATSVPADGYDAIGEHLAARGYLAN
jgi:uncharacterized peroxidase-related enzyme